METSGRLVALPATNRDAERSETHDGLEIAVPVTLRELEEYVSLPEWGWDSEEHESLLDDPTILRLVYARGHDCQAGVDDDGEYQSLDVEEYVAELCSLSDGPSWRSITSHATSSWAELGRMNELRKEMVKLYPLLLRVCDSTDIAWIDDMPCACDECCNRDECCEGEDEDDGTW